jgi:RNA polymerase sigma factor (sigma-70 family)
MDTDAELLQRFAACADEAAFRELVERYAGMVYGVAVRILGEAAPAEEVSQAVFTILARKARGLGQKKLSGWLHDAAVLEARNHARKVARYRRAVSAYQNEMSASSNKGMSWEDVSPHLDEALARLPERSKSMVIMRFYQRLSFREIASAFGKSEEASRKEVDRSVQLLGTLLKKRGITTTGAALSVMLGAQMLYVSPASAAALATASLQGLPLTAWPLMERLVDWARGLGEGRRTLTVAVLALMPAAVLMARNHQLEREVQILKQSAAVRPAASSVPAPPAVAALTVAPEAERVPAAPANNNPLHNPAKAQEQARELSQQELTRLSLNLPGLTEEQKAGLFELLTARNAARLTAKMEAFSSGAVRRYALNPDELPEEDKALLYAMEPARIPPAQDAGIKAVLTPEQFEAFVRTEEAKRISNAEAEAGDVLKAIGRSFDLAPAQKDRIFEALARLELEGAPMDAAQQARPFGGRDAQEEARDRIVLAELTPEQAEVYSKNRAERKAGYLEFLKSFGPKESPGESSP